MAAHGFAVAAKVGNIQGDDLTSAEKVRDQIDLFNNSSRALKKASGASSSFAVFKIIDPGPHPHGVDPGEVLAMDFHQGFGWTKECAEVDGLLDGATQMKEDAISFSFFSNLEHWMPTSIS